MGGYCKVALDNYEARDFGNPLAHLTNACMQKTHPEYRSSLRGAHIWSEEEAEAEVVKSGKWPANAGHFWAGVHDKMKRVLVSIYKASRGQLERRRGYFDLLGVDFLLDEDLQLHILEMNSNPAMFFDSSPTLEELVPRLIADVLDLVLASHRPGGGDSITLPRTSAFECIVDEAAQTFYGQK